jgi:hypothetical protein
MHQKEKHHLQFWWGLRKSSSPTNQAVSSFARGTGACCPSWKFFLLDGVGSRGLISSEVVFTAQLQLHK